MKCGIGEEMAFIDLEYGHVHGTNKRVSMPTEVGIAFYNEKTNSVDYSSRKFTYDIDIEQWKNITDQYGNKIDVAASVANLKKREYNKKLDKSFKLKGKQKKKAYQITGRAYRDLYYFMNNILETKEIDKLVFLEIVEKKTLLKEQKLILKVMSGLIYKEKLRMNMIWKCYCH